MRFATRLLSALPFILALFFLDSKEASVNAQAKKGAQTSSSPQAPQITSASPSGGQRGTTVEVRLTGTNLDPITGVWTSFAGKATVVPPDGKDKTNSTRAAVKIDVAADAPLGFHALRVVTKYGLSNAVLFCVDELPQIAEVETNHTKSTAQAVTAPCVVMGRADPELSDFFKINVKAGQRLTFEVLGRRLGSAFDPIILLHDAKTGRELPGLYSDDAPGLQSDARLTHTFKEAGDYLIEVRDSTHRGGPDNFYRLRIGDSPAVLSAIPVALKRGVKSLVSFTGPAVEGIAPIEVTAPSDPTKSVIYVAPKSPGGVSAWPVPIHLSDFDELAETEPNNDIAKANRISAPGGVTGRFLEKGDIDLFSFPAKKGMKYTIAAETYEIGSPAEVYLILKNAKSVELGKSVPTAPNARIEYTAAEDGDFYVHVEHLNYAHGPNEIYHLTVLPGEPGFDVSLGIDGCETDAGGGSVIPVTGIIRRDYTGPIELSIVGHPKLSGGITIPAGVPPATPAPQPGKVYAYLPVVAKSDLPSGAYEFRVQAKGSVQGKDIVRMANVSDIVKVRMGNLAFPPREMATTLVAGIVDKPLFRLAIKPGTPPIKLGTPTTLNVVVERNTGFDDEIVLAATGLPANVTAAVKPLAKGTNEIPIQITAAPTFGAGPLTFVLKGTAKPGGKEFAYFSMPVTIEVEADKAKEKEKAKDKK